MTSPSTVQSLLSIFSNLLTQLLAPTAASTPDLPPRSGSQCKSHGYNKDFSDLDDGITGLKSLAHDSGYPFGASLVGPIFCNDPAPALQKYLILAVTAVLISLVPNSGRMLAGSIAAAAEDNMQHLKDYEEEQALLEVASQALLLSQEDLLSDLKLAVGAFAVLILLHILGARWPKRWFDPSINPYATACYDEMFAEPISVSHHSTASCGCSSGCDSSNTGVTRTKKKRTKEAVPPSSPRHNCMLIARWGNTLSNTFYLATGITVVHSVAKLWKDESYRYRLADGLFGFNLLLLSLFSTVWHAANFNKEHYLDLWAMDSAILYLVFRFIAIGLSEQALAASSSEGSEDGSSMVIPHCLFAFYFGLLAVGFRSYLAEMMKPFGRGVFDMGFSPSGRRRLSKINPNGDFDMKIWNMCLYAGLPVLYISLPMAIMRYCKAIGSLVALRWLCGSLTVGWAYRMLERFCADGHTPLAFINSALAQIDVNISEINADMEMITAHLLGTQQRLEVEAQKLKKKLLCKRGTLRFKAVVLRAVAAVLSPTAVLHWATGITLFAGFVHVRSLDAELLFQLLDQLPR